MCVHAFVHACMHACVCVCACLWRLGSFMCVKTILKLDDTIDEYVIKLSG